MSYIGGAGALVLETQSVTGSWFNGFGSTTDPLLGSVIGFSDDLVPTADNAYDIGTNLKRVKVLHVTKINDNATGETLEIGNYGANNAVVSVYGDLQGKDGNWILYSSGSNGRLEAEQGNLQLSSSFAGGVVQFLRQPVSSGDWGILLNNAALSQWITMVPPIGAANGYISSSRGIELLTGTGNLYTSSVGASINATGAIIATAGTTATINAGASSGVFINCDFGTCIRNSAGSSNLWLKSTTSGSTITTSGAGNTTITLSVPTLALGDGTTSAVTIQSTNDVNTVAGRYITLTPGSAYGVFVNSDVGMAVRNSAQTHGLYMGASNTGSAFTTNGSGNASISFNTATITLANSTTSTVNIAAGAASASTTTTNIGCAVAASTNTINIGRIAANDVTNVTGVMMRTPEFVTVALTSNYTLTATGNQGVPSLATVYNTARYLQWDDANHRFTNTHGSKTLYVLFTVIVNWNTSIASRTFFMTNGTDATCWFGWPVGNSTITSISGVVPLAAGATMTPYFSTSAANEIVQGNASAANSRFTITATVI